MVIAERCDPQYDLAVVDQEPRAFFHGFENLDMRQADTFLRARRFVQINPELVAGREFDRAVCKGSDAQFRPLQIGQNADRAPDFLFHLSNDAVPRANVFVRAVAHIQAKNVDAGEEQFLDHLVAAGRRAKRRDYLNVAISFHFLVFLFIGFRFSVHGIDRFNRNWNSNFS